MRYRNQRIALIIPCFNEEKAIVQVIKGFRLAMEELAIYVFDNNSTDQTSAVAKNAGAAVILVPMKGKGNVVRRMFSDIEADLYVMVDGDATYDPSAITAMIDRLLDERLDMVVGCRQVDDHALGEAYRRGHQWGNRLLTQSVVRIFGGHFTDMLSGYRVFTRRYVKSFPALSHGFEIETELTVHALELRMPFGEVQTNYGARPEGSVSKLSTYADGWRILKTIGKLFVSERPLAFFSTASITLALLSLFLFIPI
jgi:glycosyltransferase involved in cell wall biosynthesis